MCPTCIANAAMMAAGAGGDGWNSCGVHCEVQKVFQSEWSKSVRLF